ncbi:MAG: DUF350 domain-containing protein [Bacteroidia bacterium]|nr:DUF350 domain-containing protein [Bacteroidia bacterium]
MSLLEHPETILIALSYLVLYVIVFFLAKWVKGLTASYNLDEQLTVYDNVAVAVSAAGYFIGVTCIFIGAVADSHVASPMDGLMEWLSSAGYAVGGILLLQVSRVLNERLILNKFSVEKEIIKDRNPGTGVVEGAVYVASGMIIGGSIQGEGGGPLTALVFWALGQLCLILFARIYERLSPYNVHEEIERDNVAAGLGFSGGLISIGVIIMKAVSGNFSGWQEDLIAMGLDVAIVLVYLVFVRFIFDRFVLRHSDLNTEISQDQNIGAGLLEMVVSIAFSAVLYAVI